MTSSSAARWWQRLGERWKSAVTQGVVWTTGGYGLSQALRLATNLIVTRLLNPEAFGLMAIVDTLLIGLQMVSDTGIVQTLVQRKDPPDRDLLNTAWSIHALRGVLLCGALVLMARPLASWYGEPTLVWLLTVSGVVLILEGLQSTGKFVAAREMALRRLVLVDVVVQLSGIAIVITCAWLYHSVWALVAGQPFRERHRSGRLPHDVPGSRNAIRLEARVYAGARALRPLDAPQHGPFVHRHAERPAADRKGTVRR